MLLKIDTDKVYDGTTDVAVSYDFTEEFKSAITGFAPADVGFEISASVPDKNALATPYKVTLSGATVSGANYVEADNLKDLLDIKAEFYINRRQLTLSIEFATAIYSGATSPTIGGSAIVEGLVAGESSSSPTALPQVTNPTRVTSMEQTSSSKVRQSSIRVPSTCL